MLKQRITRSVLFSLAVVAGATSSLSAQTPLFEWRGRVDSEVRIAMRGGQVWTQDVSGRQTRNARARVSRALPTQPGQVQLELLDGRGNVSVIQQPNARNDYTTIMRIVDRSGGADRYRVAAYWLPRGGGGVSGGDVDFGYSSGMLRWAGQVDDQAEIRIQGRNVQTRNLSGNGTRDVRARLSRPLPRSAVNVQVRERQGRGTVSVVQQPDRWNGYTAVIRIRDRQGGFGYYDLDVTW